MDFEHNGQNVTNFMHKVKKQAKRLFQLSKSNQNNLQVTSLSKAQEILAQINGYPDWHALEKHLSSSKNVLVKEKNEKNIELEKYDYGNLHFLSVNESITSILRVNSLNTGTSELLRSMSNFNDMFSFPINMGIHDIGIYFEQKQRTHNKENGYSLYEVSKSFNLTEEEAKNLFYVDKSKSASFMENGLTIYLIITTDKKYKDEHMNLCLSILDNNDINFESMPYLEKEHLESLQLNNSVKNDKLENSLLKYPLYDKKDEEIYYLLTKWVYLLNYLSDKKIGFLLKYSLIEKTIEYKFENYENNKDLIDNLITSAIKTNKFNTQELKYISKPNFNYINEINNKGLSLKSMLDNRVFNYHSSSSMRTSHIDLIYGKPGSGKSVLNNMIALSSILDKDLSNLPKLGIIDIGPSYEGMINLVKNLLPVELKHTVKQFNIENNEKFALNLFDLHLGKKTYDYEDFNRIVSVIKSLFQPKEGLTALLNTAIPLINDFSHKKYENDKEIQIDKLLKSLNYSLDSRTTWWEVVDFLFSNGYDKLAFKAQKYATPILSDFISILSHSKIIEVFGKVVTDTQENLIDYSKRILTETITKYPFINQTTQIDLTDIKIAYFNLDKVSNFREETIQSFWFSLILDTINHHILGTNIYTTRLYSNEWKEDWKTYLKDNSIEIVYDYYHHQKIKNNWQIQNKIIIDEFHRFINNEANIDKLINTVRESRKNYIGVSISTQSLKGLDMLLDYTTALFTSEAHFDKEILKQYGFTNNELKLMENMRFSSWGVYLKTNRGRMFDIIKVEIPDNLQFAFSSLNEDLLIKKELQKKYDYFQILNKSVQFLSDNKIKTFKIYIEQQKEKGMKFENIIEQILNNIK